MKAQISRDSFDGKKDYSAVYQQQGRMLTDADWNEMVRILKQRMDRTVGAAIESGSPRDGGILLGSKGDHDAFKSDPRFRFGRVYVDGLYGEIRRVETTMEFALSQPSITHLWSSIGLQSEFTASPVVLTGIQTFAGGDTAATRLQMRSVAGFDVKIEEEASRDPELVHASEQVGYLALAPGEILDAEGNRIGEAGFVARAQPDRATWHSIKLKHGGYSNPVVAAQLMSIRGTQPAHTRIRNIDGDSFELQVEEWKYLDGLHPAEDIGYVVLEAGQHVLGDETRIEVGTVDTEHDWTNVAFATSFVEAPTILSHCQTFNGNDPVVTRQRNVSKSGVEIRLQAEEAIGTHIAETVGYIAGETHHSIINLIRYQRDFPSNPWDKLEPESTYTVYVDLWERLVVASEDPDLTDTALHGADTCVRTQTMAQIKLARDVSALLPRGTARIAATVGTVKRQSKDCYSMPQGDTSLTESNTLLRVEVHAVEHSGGKTAVTLKWSAENGAVERSNEDKSENGANPEGFLGWGFLLPQYIYECFSTETEKHLGQHLVDGLSGWSPLSSRLYTKDEYLADYKTDEKSAARVMKRIRRWDGRVTLTRDGAGQWAPDGGETSAYKVEKDPTGSQSLKLTLKAGDSEYDVTLLLDDAAQPPIRFLAGDYWLILLRDTGSALTATPLSTEPVGIEHHYLPLGTVSTDAAGQISYDLDEPTWRRLSFPSLTRLTLDRVLIDNNSGVEIPITEKFVHREGGDPGGVMTGDLTVNADVFVQGALRTNTLELVPPQFRPVKEITVAGSVLSKDNQVQLSDLTDEGFRIEFDGPAAVSTSQLDVTVDVPINAADHDAILVPNEYYERIVLPGRVYGNSNIWNWMIQPVSPTSWLRELFTDRHAVSRLDWFTMTDGGWPTHIDYISGAPIADYCNIEVVFSPSNTRPWGFELVFAMFSSGGNLEPPYAAVRVVMLRGGGSSIGLLYTFGDHYPDQGVWDGTDWVRETTVALNNDLDPGNTETRLQVDILGREADAAWELKASIPGNTTLSSRLKLPSRWNLGTRVGLRKLGPCRVSKISVLDKMGSNEKLEVTRKSLFDIRGRHLLAFLNLRRDPISASTAGQIIEEPNLTLPFWVLGPSPYA